jgi:hypothetical protein
MPFESFNYCQDNCFNKEMHACCDPPNAIEFSRLRLGAANYILRQLGRQGVVEKRKGSKSAAMSG